MALPCHLYACREMIIQRIYSNVALLVKIEKNYCFNNILMTQFTIEQGSAAGR